MKNYLIVYSDSLSHHGIQGQKWGVRRYQNKDGSLTPKGKMYYNVNSDGSLSEKSRSEKKAEIKESKKYNKIKNSEDAKVIYKHRNELSIEDFNAAYDRLKKVNDLKEINGKNSISRKIAVAAGKEAAKVAFKAAVITGGVLFLTKTQTGRDLVEKGKTAATKAISNAVKNTATGVTETASEVVKTATSAVKESAKETRRAGQVAMKRAIKNGNPAAKALYTYGKTVDRVIKGVKR